MYLIIYVPAMIVYVAMCISDSGKATSYIQLDNTDAEVEKMARSPLYHASLIVCAFIGVLKILEVSSYLLRHLVRPTPWVGQDPDPSIIMRIHVLFILAYAAYIGLGMYALHDIDHSDGVRGLSPRPAEYVFNWFRIVSNHITWELRVLLAPEVFRDIRCPISIIIRLFDIILLPYIGAYAGSGLYATLIIIELSLMRSLCKHFNISYADIFLSYFRDLPKSRNKRCASHTDGLSGDNGSEDASNPSKVSGGPSDEDTPQDGGQLDEWLLSDTKRKLTKFSENFRHLEDSQYQTTNAWLLEFTSGFKRHNARCTAGVQAAIVCFYSFIFIFRVATFIARDIGNGDVRNIDPVARHIVRCIVMFAVAYALQFAYDINESYILQQTETCVYHMRRETNVGINLLFRILPSHIVDKIVMDVSSGRRSDRIAWQRRMEEGGYPVVCNDFVAQRIPRKVSGNSTFLQKQFYGTSAAGDSVSLSSHGHTPAHSGSRHAGTRDGATKASSEASSDSLHSFSCR
jgi:hypothetical protein